MKFSIIVPVYNVEKYLKKCLDSLLNQTYKDFEVIIVNDGSKDNSQKIVDKYIEKDERFKSFIKENGGLSDARNFGLKYVTGNYILFLDSDDYIDKELLEKVNNILSKDNNIDIVKYNLVSVDENENIILKENIISNEGYIKFKDIIKSQFIETAVNCFYSTKFWEKNNFKYEVGKIHEDFGLTPFILAKAKSIYYIPFYGYYYVQRTGSIMNGGSKAYKSACDTLYHFDNLLKNINLEDNIDIVTKKYFLSFISNGVIGRAKSLDLKDKKLYLKEIKKRNVASYLIDDTISRKIKKIIANINYNLYINLFVK